MAQPDPWLGLQEAADNIVYLSGNVERPTWSPIRELAVTAFAVAKRLKIDVRWLHSRVSNLGDRSAALEERVGEHGERVKALEGSFADLIQVCKQQQVLIDRLVDETGLDAKHDGANSDPPPAADLVVVPRRLINFISDGRWDAESALRLLVDWEKENGRHDG